MEQLALPFSAPRGLRDSQRMRLYRAEATLRGAHLPRLDQCRDFLHEVVLDPWWRSRFPALGPSDLPDFRPGHGARRAFFRIELGPPHGTGRPSITLPRRYRTQHVVLHEAAHWALEGRGDVAPHGPTFARLLLDLTDRFRGRRAATVLAEHYHDQRVRVGAPARRDRGLVAYGPDRSRTGILND
jgi:hypothetical protein